MAINDIAFHREENSKCNPKSRRIYCV